VDQQLPKGKGLGRLGGKGGIRAGRKKGCIGGMSISVYTMCGRRSMGRSVQHREDSRDYTPSYYMLMGRDLRGFTGGMVNRKPSKHNVLHVIVA